MQNVFNFFVMFYKDFLEYVHKAIMKEAEGKVLPPLKIEGLGKLMRLCRFVLWKKIDLKCCLAVKSCLFKMVDIKQQKLVAGLS